MRFAASLIVISGLMLTAGSAWGAAAQTAVTSVESACTPEERWTFSDKFSPESIKDFRGLVGHKVKPVFGFSEALALRRFARSAEAQTVGEYWISRSLHEAKLFHIAHGGFASISSKPVQPETAPAQFAALACLLEIQARTPSLATPDGVYARLPEYQAQAKTAWAREIVWAAAAASVRSQLGDQKRKPQEVEPTLQLLKGAGAYELLSRGLWAVRSGKHNLAVSELERFINLPAHPAHLKRFIDTAHILTARALYTTGEFEKAVPHLRSVKRSSNELASSLSELAWAQLMAENYGEAIGTALNLQTGGLRHTFAPESPMVMAMAMNELCQYPSSVDAIRIFQKDYDSSYRWLSRWSQEQKPLYPLAVQFLRKTSKQVPDRVANEWVRSPLFISLQEELNLLFDERDSASALGKMGASEQRKLVSELIAFIREFKPKLHLAKMKQQGGAPLPDSIQDGLEDLRSRMTRLRRLQQAAPVWRAVLANHIKQVPSREKELVARINEDLDGRSGRMLQQLDEIAENLQLVEVEIYNGASHDIIWQNAHPDYKVIAQKLKDDRESVGREKTWDWGRAPSSAEDAGEIWEDELGSFKANLFDNCSSKDKYLALKMKRAQ